MQKKAFIVLADGFEEIEAITVIDVLRRAGIEVCVAGLESKNITGAHSISVICDAVLNEIDPLSFDALVLPGGTPGAEQLASSSKLLKIISLMYSENKLVSAICASPALVLSKTSVLENKRVTCYPGLQHYLGENVNYTAASTEKDGNLITSSGPGTAIEFALVVVEELTDRSAVNKLKEKMLL